MIEQQDRSARMQRIKESIRPDQDRERVLGEIERVAHDDARLAALELWVDRVGAQPPVKVTPEDYDRLFADKEGKGAVRLLCEELDQRDVHNSNRE